MEKAKQEVQIRLKAGPRTRRKPGLHLQKRNPLVMVGNPLPKEVGQKQ
jgi:hypothetical protein